MLRNHIVKTGTSDENQDNESQVDITIAAKTSAAPSDVTKNLNELSAEIQNFKSINLNETTTNLSEPIIDTASNLLNQNSAATPEVANLNEFKINETPVKPVKIPAITELSGLAINTDNESALRIKAKADAIKPLAMDQSELIKQELQENLVKNNLAPELPPSMVQTNAALAVADRFIGLGQSIVNGALRLPAAILSSPVKLFKAGYELNEAASKQIDFKLNAFNLVSNSKNMASANLKIQKAGDGIEQLLSSHKMNKADLQGDALAKTMKLIESQNPIEAMKLKAHLDDFSRAINKQAKLAASLDLNMQKALNKNMLGKNTREKLAESSKEMASALGALKDKYSDIPDVKADSKFINFFKHKIPELYESAKEKLSLSDENKALLADYKKKFDEWVDNLKGKTFELAGGLFDKIMEFVKNVINQVKEKVSDLKGSADNNLDSSIKEHGERPITP